MTTSTSPTKSTTSPNKKTSLSKTTGDSNSNPVDLTESSTATGDKRKAPSNEPTTTSDDTKSKADADAGEGGKDLVEKKQTTLDDVVSHEIKAAESINESKPKEGEDKDGKRPSKKTKVDTEEEKAGEKVEKKEENVDEPIEVDDKPTAEIKESTSDSNGNGNDSKNETAKVTPSKTDSDQSNAKTTPPTTNEGTSAKPAPNSNVVQTPSTTADAPPVSTTADAPPVTVTGGGGDTIPGDQSHLDHPENWATGGDPATDKQKGFLKVLEKQKGVQVGDVSEIGKSEASEKIDELKNMSSGIKCEMEPEVENMTGKVARGRVKEEVKVNNG